MRRTARWVAGVVLLAAAGPAAAQTSGGALTAPIPRSNKAPVPGGGPAAGTGLNTAAPIRTGGGFTPGGRFMPGGPAAGVGSGTAAGVGVGAGLPGGGRPPLSLGQELLLLTEARLLVEQVEAAGNVVLDRRESLVLTLLVYEGLRRQVVPAGVGPTGAAPAGASGQRGGPLVAGFPIR